MRANIQGVLRRIVPLALLSAAFCAGGSAEFPRRHSPTPDLPRGGTYSVFLPPSYSGGSRRYPVLYFLHDAYGDDRVLEKNGVVGRLDAAMRSGALGEFVLVCPEGDGGWFSNSHDGRRRYEDWIAGDLPKEIERTYRILPGAASRGITGISMGGYGAVKLALRHPESYGAVSGLSAAVIPMEWDDVQKVFFVARWQIHRVFGSSRADNSLAENDVWKIAGAREKWSVPFDVFLLAGTEDKYRLDRVAAQYADFLNRHGIRTTARLEPGIHDWPYWRNAMLEIARWHASKFAAAR
jgi:S-formylglutathione hydrolase FrmB